MRHVKVMAAYLCPPIWLYRDASGIPQNVDVRDLPIPRHLAARIEAWDETYQETFFHGRGFATEGELADHGEEGLVLTHELALALQEWADVTIYEPSGEMCEDVDIDAEFTIVQTRTARFDSEPPQEAVATMRHTG